MNNDKIFEYCNTMIAVVCTLFPFGCCIQINHYSTSTSLSLFVRMLYVQLKKGENVKKGRKEKENGGKGKENEKRGSKRVK
jgi:hypothetical protein